MSKFLFCLLSVGLFFQNLLAAQQSHDQFFNKMVKGVFESRCIGCHSCYNAPCQLNLQSYQGFERGALDKNIYDGFRLKSVTPTRMFIDANSTEEWREKGFYSVNNSKSVEDNLFLEVLRIRRDKPDYKMLTSIETSLICPKKIESTKILGIKNYELGMPFGFPPLSDKEYSALEQWVAIGAPPPPTLNPQKVRKAHLENISLWEQFLNRDQIQQKLVSRYIYEHLFLAHIYFEGNNDHFYRLVRSKTECSKEIQEIASRRPNDDPGTERFFYCLKPVEPPFMQKTHMPFEFSNSQLKNWKELFFEKVQWKVKKLPTYSPEVAQNPFVAFGDIPATVRYRFLLNNAHFFINNFIKGPVCNGTNAVNSIQDQFYVFFIAPSSDPMNDPDHQKKSERLLTLPGSFGSDVEVTDVPTVSKKITELREEYRSLRQAWLQTHKPQGLGIKDVWDGDKVNDNAVLTVFRHNDNAVVQKGTLGNTPKTVFLLDYSLFERLVYNLVVNFDVFGNVGHQLLTRVYMDFIRMEAEENFLLLVSPEMRQAYRNSWYRGILTEAKMKYIFPEISKGEPSAVKFEGKKHQKTQVIEKILEQMDDKVRGLGDSLNWRNLDPKGMKKKALSQSEKTLKKMTSIKSMGSLVFAEYFPENAYLVVKKNQDFHAVYSVIHNREFENISWIIAESLRRAPEEDTLTIAKGFLIPYPEIVYVVDEADLGKFVDEAKAITSSDDYTKFEIKYGATADKKDFWQQWDKLHDFIKQENKNKPDNGHLDLTRYRL